MMGRIKNVPALRFPDFEGEWEKVNLGSLSEFVTSGSRDWSKYYSHQGSKFIRMTNLARNGIHLILDDIKYVKLPDYNSEGKRTGLRHRDILISITAELGKIGWVPGNLGEAYINQHTALVRIISGKAESKFIAYILSSRKMNKKINRLNDSGAKSGLNLSTVRSFLFNHPDLLEQQKIASFLTAVDDKIQQLTEKQALLQRYKKGVMQQIFSQKIRFKTDDGTGFPDWRAKQLGEIAEINPKNGQIPDTFKYIDLEAVENGVLKEVTKLTKALAPSRAQRTLSPQDILFQIVRPYQRNNLFFDFDGVYVASTGYAQLRAHKSSKFLFQLLHTDDFVRAVLARCTGTSYPAINSSDLANVTVYVSSEREEQQKIANCLSTLDDKINAVTDQLTHMQTFKKGLLQQMFV